MRYPIYTPDIGNYVVSIKNAIDSGWISSQGEYIDKTRSLVSSILGSPYVVLVNNGTSATHLLYKSLKFKYPELQRIYVPDYVFAAVWNCALYEYPVDMLRVLPTDPATMNPVFEDIEPNSAVVIVHNIGNIVNVPELKRRRPDLVFVEDCCEAFLETYEGKYTGTKSLCAAVSFFANKIVTTGEGGLWYTYDKELYDFIYKSCHHGMTGERYVYDVLGYNYRMTNLQSALLYDQLRDIDNILQRKRDVRSRYERLFPEWMATTGLWMNVLRIPNASYSTLASVLREYGIETRPMFYPIHTHAHLRTIQTDSTPIRHEEIVMIPSSPSLTIFDQVLIAMTIRSVVDGKKTPIVHRANRQLLESFVANEMPPTFRYFNTHTVDTCLDTHTLTLVAMEEEKPIGYAHIDDRWIGICVLPQAQSRGYGSFLLKLIIEIARLSGIPQLRLTVDRDNETAYKLYLHSGFIVEESTVKYHRMINDL